MDAPRPSDAAFVTGGQCLACGHVYAPWQAFGCERCGAYGDKLKPRDLAARGRLAAAAAVYVHRHPTPATPFTVLDVALEAGPTVRVLLDGPDAPEPGAAVVGAGVGEDRLRRFRIAETEA